MASSNASIHNLSHEHIVPLESVVAGEHSRSYDGAAGVSVNSERFPRQRSPHAFQSTPMNPQYSVEATWNKILDSQAAWNAARKILDPQRVVLKRLKAWRQWDTDRYKSLSKFIMSKAGFPKRPICATPGQIFSVATYFFTPRWSLKVIVCDFGEGRFERFEVDLENVTQCK